MQGQITWDALATIANCIIAFLTALIAISAFWTIRDSQRARSEEEKQKRELGFRAAIVELANNIGNFEHWQPTIQEEPDQFWWNNPFRFTLLDDLLMRVWMPDQVFLYMMAERRLLEVRELLLRTGLASKDESKFPLNYLKSVFYWMDLYLKQLLSFVVHEAKRQGHIKLAAGIEKENILSPLRWKYAAQPDETPEMTAALARVLSFPPEPQDAIYRECRLESLIAKADELLKVKLS